MKQQITSPSQISTPSNSASSNDIRIAAKKVTSDYINKADLAPFRKFLETSQKFSENPDDKDLQEELRKARREVLSATAVENGVYLRSVTHSRDKPHVAELRNNLINEYNAYSPSELLIIDQAVSSYFRSLHTSSMLMSFLENKDGETTYSQLKINMIKELNKQIDLANRQFFTALTYLKESRQAPLNVKIHTKETFIAQNQQINQKA